MMERLEKILNRKIFNDIDISKITDYQKKQMIKILEKYNNKEIKNRLKNIHDFIKYDVDGDWLERINIIRTILKNDIASDYALEVRYGKKNVDKIKEELYPKFVHSLKKYIDKYGEEEGKIKWEEYLEKSKTPWGLDACINKYGEIEGVKKWNERLSKKINTMSERKKIRPYRNGRTLIEYQSRYGLKIGYKKWVERNNKQKYRFSKNYFINKYGEEKGKIKWDEYCLSMSKTTYKAFIERYGNVVGKIKFNEYLDKQFKSSKLYSKISQELFWLIYENIKNKTNDIKFAELNGEEVFYVDFGKRNYILVDFKYGKKIIEFDGNYWHSNFEQIEKDMLRDKYLISKGYEILRIKESEYKKNKQITINKCINFLNN